jgi:bifunctional DNA-binding transcriptional regulator/antitoxin component of YhaV-PrlF toxin-antitoxin module
MLNTVRTKETTMTAIRLTAKRQATLPKALCDDLHLKPGDAIVLESREIDGEKVWLLKPRSDTPPDWFGSLRKYAKGKSLDMDSIRGSIERGRRHGDD